MTIRIFAQRTSYPPTFKSRDDFLEKRGHSLNICSALEKFSTERPWVTVALGSGWLPEEERRAALVDILNRLERALGSTEFERWLGVLPDGTAMTDAIRRFASDMISDRLGLAPGVADLGAPVPAHRDSADDGDVWVAKVLVASMLSTNLYFTLRAIDSTAGLHRSGHAETASVPEGSTSVWAYEQVSGRVVEVLRHLTVDLSGGPGASSLAARVLETRNPQDQTRVTGLFIKSFQTVIGGIQKGLDTPADTKRRLASTDVRALTELAWFGLSSFADNTYPGWLDLLLELSHYDQPEHGAIGRPSFDNVTDASDAIRARYQRLTTESWKRATRDTANASRVHQSVAQHLVAQSSLREVLRAKKDLQHPPPAVVHVTSFDLELEMALLRAGSPFQILFPVYVLDGLTSLLHLRWCRLDVSGSDLDAVLKPDPEQVSVLYGSSREIDRYPGPVVVRLTGCPLIELPPLAVGGKLTPLGLQVLGAPPDEAVGEGSTGDVTIRRVFEKGLLTKDRHLRGSTPESARQITEERMAKQITLRHAVVVNEHDAMLHNAMDSQPADAVQKSLCRRLPIETVADENSWRRFWMLLGVQVADHAIRQRVSHVVSWYPGSDTRKPRVNAFGSAARQSVGDGQEGATGSEGAQVEPTGGFEPDDVVAGASVLGVLASRTVGPLEQDLLYWNRFDIIENAEAHHFARDLDHLVERHLDGTGGGAMVGCDGE